MRTIRAMIARESGPVSRASPCPESTPIPRRNDDPEGLDAAELNPTRSKKVRTGLDNLYARLEEFESKWRRL